LWTYLVIIAPGWASGRSRLGPWHYCAIKGSRWRKDGSGRSATGHFGLCTYWPCVVNWWMLNNWQWQAVVSKCWIDLHKQTITNRCVENVCTRFYTRHCFTNVDVTSYILIKYILKIFTSITCVIKFYSFFKYKLYRYSTINNEAC